MVKVCSLAKLLHDYLISGQILKLGWTFYCKTTVVNRHLRTNQVKCDLEFRMVECQLSYFANTTLPSPISTRCTKIWDNFWITLLFILMSKLRYVSDLPRQHMLQQLYAGSRAYWLLQVQYTEYIEF